MTEQLPVPTNPAHTIFTPRRKAAFLTQLAQSGNVRLACRAAGVSPQTAYRARRASPALEQAWDAALIAAKPIAEQVLADRALNGVEEPVFYHGEEVARRTRFDARLLLAHIGRLDALEAGPKMEAAVRDLDAQIAALESGEELAEPIDHDAPWYGDEDDDEDASGDKSDWMRAHSGERDGGVDSSWAPASAGAHGAGAHGEGDEGDWAPASAGAHDTGAQVESTHEAGAYDNDHNPVPGVPSCRENPPSSSAAVGQTETPSSSEALGQTETKGSFLQPWPRYDPAEEAAESPEVSRQDAELAETQSGSAAPPQPVAASVVRL